MKKNILLLTTLMVFIACSTKNDAFVNRTYQNFTSYYNTLFHGNEALKSELKAKKKEHKDNFYDEYIEVFPQDDLATKDQTISLMASQFFGGENQQNQQNTNSAFQRAEEKALKVIQNNSMIFNGAEKNKEIFNAYILLAKARIYQGKLFESLDALGQIYFTMPQDKRLPLAKIYEGLIYTKLKNHIRAEDIFLSLERDRNLKKEHQKLLSIYHAENLLYSNKKEEAVEQLDLAMILNKNRETRSRIAFLRGQILSELEKKEEARESFVTAYKYSNDFEFEVKSQIEIAKTFSINDNYEEAKKYLEKISKKRVYTDRKNEFYYALGIMANIAEQEKDAQEFFQKSVKEKFSDNNIRGLAYFEIGKYHFDKEGYIRAGAYYDSALVVIEHENTRQKIEELSSNIKNFSKNYYLIKKNDSILALTQMTESQRIEFFQKYINELKEKETKQFITEQKKSKKSEPQNYSNIELTSFTDNFNNQPQKYGKFYFSNLETIAKGSKEFKKIWGNRSLNDNWRISFNENITTQEVENKTLGRDNLANPRRFEIAYYTEKIPTNKEEILALKKDRDTASLGLGRMYENYFQNTPKATETLFNLVEQNPEDEVKLQALYSIFSMNYEKNIAEAERAKSLILQNFPYTPYAEFVKNPKKNNFTQKEDSVRDIYQKAYEFFTEEKFDDARELIIKTIEQYPQDALIPKFELLNAFITGKTAGKEVMILQLQQIVFNYEKTAEGAKAKEILTYLKSDLEEKSMPTKSSQPKKPLISSKRIIEDSKDIQIKEAPNKEEKEIDFDISDDFEILNP